MIFYLPLADNVGNEGAGAFPSSALAGHARGRATHPRVRDDAALKTRHQ